MGGKSTTSTQSVKIPPEVLARYNAVNARAEEAAAQPFQPYTGQFVAGLTDLQRAGMAGLNRAAGMTQQYYDTAAEMTRAGSRGVGPLTREQIRYYQDPYTESVVQPTLQALRQQQGQERAMQQAQAIRSGGFGGDRAGLERANLARQQALGTAQAISPLYSQGYQLGLQTAAGQQGVEAQNLQRQLAAGQQYAGLGTGLQQAALQGAQAQIGAGTLEQQTQQADMTARYQQFLQERGYPFQVAQFLANIAMGTGALSGSTTTTTQPTGFFSDRRLKDDVAPIGKTFDGQTIYRYKYKGDDRTQIGLMADEVQKRKPEAVGLHDGYKTVDYEEATEDAARAKKAGGGLVGADDLRAILEAQRAGFGPFGGGVYGGAGQGMPMGKGGLGYVPQGALPVPKLVTAAGLGAPRPSGLSEAMQTGRNIADMAKMGKAGLFGTAPTRDDPQGSRGLIGARGKVGMEGGFLTGGLGGTTTTTTEPGAAPAKPATAKPAPATQPAAKTPEPPRRAADLPSAQPTMASLDKEGLGLSLPEGVDDLATTMFAARGGVVPSRYAAGGSVNPYDLGGGLDYFPQEVLEDGEQKRELLKAGQLNAPGRSGLSQTVNAAGTLASLIPGVGPVVGTGMKFASMFMADGGAVDDGGTFAYGGVVPRRGYATDGAVETPEPSQEDIDFMARTMLTEAGNQGEVGQAAVGHVIRNRLAEGRYGTSIPEVVTRPKQFTPWNPEMQGTKSDPRLIDPESDAYKASADLARRVLRGEFEDPTGGATHFANVDTVRAQRGELQPWLRGMIESGNVKQIGAHTFGRADAGAGDLPSRGARPVSYEGGLGGGRREGPIADRSSSLGDVFERMTPEGIPTSSRFWVPALGFVGSMLASQRPTLGAALGEGILGGVGAYQEQRKQEADLAKGAFDLLKSRFVRTKEGGQDFFIDTVTRQRLTPRQVNDFFYNYYTRLGLDPKAQGITPPESPQAPSLKGGEPQRTADGAVKGLPAPASQPMEAGKPGEGAQPPGQKAPEQPEWLSKPPSESDLVGLNKYQLKQVVEKYPDYYGFKPGETPAEQRAKIAELRREANDRLADDDPNVRATAQTYLGEAKDLESRLEARLDGAIALDYARSEEQIKAEAKTATQRLAEVTTRANSYTSRRDDLLQLAKIYEDLQAGRLVEVKANLQGIATSLGMTDVAKLIAPGTQAAYDLAFKQAMQTALNQIAESGFQRAPLAMAEKEISSLPEPSKAPFAVYKLLGDMIGHLDYQMERDEAYVKSGRGTLPVKFDMEYAKRKDKAPSKSAAKVMQNEMPVFRGMTTEEIESLRKKYNVDLRAREAAKAGAETAPSQTAPQTLPEALRGVEGLSYSPSRRQYRDAAGNIYDETGKRVQ